MFSSFAFLQTPDIQQLPQGFHLNPPPPPEAHTHTCTLAYALEKRANLRIISHTTNDLAIFFAFRGLFSSLNRGLSEHTKSQHLHKGPTSYTHNKPPKGPPQKGGSGNSWLQMPTRFLRLATEKLSLGSDTFPDLVAKVLRDDTRIEHSPSLLRSGHLRSTLLFI